MSSALPCATPPQTLDDVKAFFTSERFSDPDSFLAEINALDLDGNIRNLSGDKMSYFDGNTADPILLLRRRR